MSKTSRMYQNYCFFALLSLLFLFLVFVFPPDLRAAARDTVTEPVKWTFLQEYRIPSGVHARFGRDTREFTAISAAASRLYLLRRYGVYVLRVGATNAGESNAGKTNVSETNVGESNVGESNVGKANKSAEYKGFIPLPKEAGLGQPQNLLADRGGFWVGLDSGFLFRYNREDKSWDRYNFEAERLLLSRGREGLFVSENSPGGAVYVYRPAGKRFRTYLQLPKEYKISPGPIRQVGGNTYLMSDAGLFRLNIGRRQNLDIPRWRQLGARDYLTRTRVTDIAVCSNILLAAGSRVQYPRLAANLRLSSFGRFYYNYFQKRWFRFRLPLDAAKKTFISINSGNNHVPDGGLWRIDPQADRAYPFFDLSANYRRLYSLNREAALGLAREGLFFIGAAANGFYVDRIAVLEKLHTRQYIAGLSVVAGRVFIASGERLFSFQTDIMLSSARRRYEKGKQFPQTEAAETGEEKTTDDESQPGSVLDGALSEEELFMRQIERWMEENSPKQ